MSFTHDEYVQAILKLQFEFALPSFTATEYAEAIRVLAGEFVQVSSARVFLTVR
jgi:hypothetical protein